MLNWTWWKIALGIMAVTAVVLGIVAVSNSPEGLGILLSAKDYWYATVSAVLGALIGIRWTISQFARERDRNLRRCVSNLRETLQFNLDRLRQAENMLASQHMIPNYPLDTAQLNHWLIQSHDFFDEDLLRALNWERYQLDHISAKFVVVSQWVTSIGTRAMTTHEQQYLAAMQNDLLQHVRGVIGNLPSLIERIPQTAQE